MDLGLGLGIGLVKKLALCKRIFQTVLLIKLRNSRITFNLWLIQLLREKEFIEDIHELQKELYFRTIDIILDLDFVLRNTPTNHGQICTSKCKRKGFLKTSLHLRKEQKCDTQMIL